MVKEPGQNKIDYAIILIKSFSLLSSVVLSVETAKQPTLVAAFLPVCFTNHCTGPAAVKILLSRREVVWPWSRLHVFLNYEAIFGLIFPLTGL